MTPEPTESRCASILVSIVLLAGPGAVTTGTDISAAFADGTTNGLVLRGAPGVRVRAGRVVAPTASTWSDNGAALTTPGTYLDQTAILRFARVPRSASIAIDYYFWGDGPDRTGWGQAPHVRIAGSSDAPTFSAYREPDGAGGSAPVAAARTLHTALTDGLTIRVVVSGSTVMAWVNDEALFSAPVAVNVLAPAGGGTSRIAMAAVTGDGGPFELDYVLIRASDAMRIDPDVFVDAQHNIWFSLVQNGRLFDELVNGIGTHVVQLTMAGGTRTIGFDWRAWSPLVPLTTLEGVGLADHWFYALPASIAHPGDRWQMGIGGVGDQDRVGVVFEPRQLEHLWAWAWAGAQGQYIRHEASGCGPPIDRVDDLSGLGHYLEADGIGAGWRADLTLDATVKGGPYRTDLPLIAVDDLAPNSPCGPRWYQSSYHFPTPMVTSGAFYMAAVAMNTRVAGFREIFGHDPLNHVTWDQAENRVWFTINGFRAPASAAHRLPDGIMLFEFWRDVGNSVHVAANQVEIADSGLVRTGSVSFSGIGWDVSGTSYWDDYLMEVFVCDGLPPLSQRAALWVYARTKWGIDSYAH